MSEPIVGELFQFQMSTTLICRSYGDPNSLPYVYNHQFQKCSVGIMLLKSNSENVIMILSGRDIGKLFRFVRKHWFTEFVWIPYSKQIIDVSSFI